MGTLWDPLKNLTESEEEILRSRKRDIQNILKSYVGFYDAFCELIQNAMDAVEARQAAMPSEDYKKHIWIEVNLKENSLSVTDNGIGFKEAEFKIFLAPSVTFKKPRGKTRGKKGVGATYLAYGFNYLQAGTRTSELELVTELKDGKRWAEDQDNVVTRPTVSDSVRIHDAFDRIDRGSTFTVKFGADQTKQRTLTWIAAKTAEQWKAILLLKTPLGQIHNGEDEHDRIHFDLKVVDKDGLASEIHNQEAAYLYPHMAVKAAQDLKPILVAQQRQVAKNAPQKTPTKYTNLNAVYYTWDAASLAELVKTNWDKRPEFVELIGHYSITAYAFFCYTVKVWDSFNDDVMNLRKGARIMRGGLQLATDRMLQGEMILIPLTSNQGHQNQAHVVVHFANADPDLGRKGFQPELREVAEAISVSVVNNLRQWRHLLKKDTGAAPSIVNDTELDEWIREQVEHERSSPLVIRNRHFFAPAHEVSIASTPRSEQDVIVLFNQLIAGGVIRGLRMLATNQVAQYDAVFRYVVRPPAETHIFDRDANPLGVEQLLQGQEVGFESRALVLEYKYNVDGLIHEFDNGEKRERDVNLVVAWEMGTGWQERYSITSLLDLDNVHIRHCHGVTHAFHDMNSGDLRFFGVILSELVAYLDDIDGAQAYHRATYGTLA